MTLQPKPNKVCYILLVLMLKERRYSSSDAVCYVKCVVCGCRLTAENQSSSPNVCRVCLHSLEF